MSKGQWCLKCDGERRRVVPKIRTLWIDGDKTRIYRTIFDRSDPRHISDYLPDRRVR